MASPPPFPSPPPLPSLQMAVVDWAWTFSSPRLRVFPTSFASEEKASSDTSSQDLLLAFGGYGLLTVYLLLVLWRPRDRVKSQAGLALPAIISVFMAVGSSFGLSAALGVEYNPAVASLLFVLMGVGVDDAFVILEAYHSSEVPYYDVVKRVGSSVGHSGAAILATTITSLVAFATESNTVMPAIQAFAVYAVLGTWRR
jgi:Niemann-Pick C1 protein